MRHSIYLHIPFCNHRCAYCDFNTFAGQEDLIPAYVAALCTEVQHVGQRAPGAISVHTIFMGGGTPSLLSADQIRCVLETLRNSWLVEDDAEITLEANPGTVSPMAMRSIRAAGVNRISIGAQSAHGEELRLLGRTHHFGDVLNAASAARRAGIENLNLDLIFGLPEQSLGSWQTSVRRVLDLRPQHLSAYALTLEHGTPFGQWARRGLLPMPDPDLAADMYEWLSKELQEAGYGQYEISNWALPGFQCQHNLQYWRGEHYLGFGAGAHGYAGGFRYSNVLSIRSYIARLSQNPGAAYVESGNDGQAVRLKGFGQAAAWPISPAALDQHRQSVQDDMGEFMMTRLRLTGEGVPLAAFRRRFGRDLWEQYGPALRQLSQQGLIESRGTETSGPFLDSDAHIDAPGVVALTPRGRFLGNRVFSEFVG